MKCPFCGFLETQVVDTRLSEEGDCVRRRRKCVACDKRFTTYESAELRFPQVVKNNGDRVDFDQRKIRTSFMRALHKRPVPTLLVEQAITAIMQRLLALPERELPSRYLGEMVMAALAQLDKVAYIRFASVYKHFQDIDDFHQAIQEIGQKQAKD